MRVTDVQSGPREGLIYRSAEGAGGGGTLGGIRLTQSQHIKGSYCNNQSLQGFISTVVLFAK